MDSSNPYTRLLEDWKTFEKELEDQDDSHRTYLISLRRLEKLQEQCQKTVKHLLYRLPQIESTLKRLEKSDVPQEMKDDLKTIKDGIPEMQRRLFEMKGELPVQNNGLYLSIILGSNLDVSLMKKNDRYRYKQEYEKFKVTVNCTLIFLLVLAFFSGFRVFDLIISFALVWYYCTLTIREAILRINGSKVKGWWLTHHYVACVLSGIMITWRDGPCYQSVRTKLALFYFYLILVQLLQCRYQRGCLRRLHALGQRHSMDITVEGFSSWMFKGLTFLIPFLISAYVYQAFIAYTLYDRSKQAMCTGEWQVWALAYGFLLVACCNMFTLLAVVINKWEQGRLPSTRLTLETKYRAKSGLDLD